MLMLLLIIMLLWGVVHSWIAAEDGGLYNKCLK